MLSLISPLKTDREWKTIEGRLCLVKGFVPLEGSKFVNGEIYSPNTSEPYAKLSLETAKLENLEGFITHKIDFANLWLAIEEWERVKDDCEVVLYWTTKHYSNGIFKLISKVLLTLLGGSNLPKVIVMLVPKGTFESAKNLDWPDDKEAMVLVYGLMSVKWWVPEAIK